MGATLEQVLKVQLRKAREAAGLTQDEVAEKAGIAVEAYGRLERGGVEPRAATLAALARALSVSTDVLLGHGGGLDGTAPAGPAEKDSPDVRRLLRRVRGLDAKAVRLLTLVAAEFGKRQPRKSKKAK